MKDKSQDIYVEYDYFGRPVIVGPLSLFKIWLNFLRLRSGCPWLEWITNKHCFMISWYYMCKKDGMLVVYLLGTDQYLRVGVSAVLNCSACPRLCISG